MTVEVVDADAVPVAVVVVEEEVEYRVVDQLVSAYKLLVSV
jgi:hypothetical protein